MSAIGVQFQIPNPLKQESPSAYADRLGRLYADLTAAEHKRATGQYFTPIEVAAFLARMYQPESCGIRAKSRSIRVLDPGAGAGILVCSLCEFLASSTNSLEEIVISAYETDARLAKYLDKSLRHAGHWLLTHNVRLRYEILTEDFVLANAEALSETQPRFQSPMLDRPKFDLVLANPPYFKIPKSDARAQAASAVVHGQPNIYAIFMAVSSRLLKENGELIFITPRSYTAGPYFQLFREKFFAWVQPRAVHLFGSRRDAFARNEVLQENVILHARRSDDWDARINEKSVEISWSAGLRDLAQPHKRMVPLAEVLDMKSRSKVLRIPVGVDDDETVRIVHSWTSSLHEYGLEISTGPVVPFRAVPLITKEGDVPQTHAPLLWMQNVSPMKIEWPVSTRNKSQFIISDKQSQPLLVKNRNYVLLRRFSAKEAERRLIAAPYIANTIASPMIGLENHLNYVHRLHGSLAEDEAYGLAALLNSALLDNYFRTFNGNTQVSATELRMTPLPPLDLIKELGRRVINSTEGLHEIDALVMETLSNGKVNVDDWIAEIPGHMIHFNGDRFLGPR